MDVAPFLETMQRLSKSLTPGDLDHTLSRITQAAVEVLPSVDFASITVLHADGRLETSAPTDKLLWNLDAAQYELREGPCYAPGSLTHIQIGTLTMPSWVALWTYGDNPSCG
ncbi:hypothetical protein AB0L70_07055, partial [Kribbella sp. NPDC051952]